MQKLFTKSSSLLLALSFIFALGIFALPQEAGAQPRPNPDPCAEFVPGSPEWRECDEELFPSLYAPDNGNDLCSMWNITQCINDALLLVPAYLSILVLKIVQWLTHLSGMILNYVVSYSVVNMAQNIEGIGAVNTAWRTIRDIGNMGFIFVLLYASITTIIGAGSDNKKLIVNIVMAAILINFSLFFTKVIIDASNVLAVFFYDAIAPGAAGRTLTQGLSANLMQPLQLQSIFDNGESWLRGERLFIIGIAGSIFALIAAFVFFAVAIMFVIRFVVLIFVLILSPIAFLSMVLPETKQYRDQWKNALIGQAFFAPIYFALTWIVIIVSRSLTQPSGSFGQIAGTIGPNGEVVAPPDTTIGLIMNFAIVIAMLIASLVIAKTWANKAPGGVSKLTSWAMGAAGGATLGMAGRFGRNVVGSRAAAMASNEDLKRRASEGSMRAKLQLAAANKASSASFDLRGTGLGGILGAGNAKKGGYKQDQKERVKGYEQYKPSGDAIKDAKTTEAQAKQRLENARREALQRAAADVPKSQELINAEKELREAQENAARPSNLVGISEADKALQNQRNTRAIEAAQRRVDELGGAHQRATNQFIKENTRDQRAVYAEANRTRAELERRMETMARRMENGSFSPLKMQGGLFVSGKAKAAAIRAAAKGKGAKDKAADILKELDKEGVITVEKPEENKDSKEEGGGEGEKKSE